MARVKITRKDLKEDELRTFGHKAYDYINKHQKKILVVLAAICVIIIGLKLYSLQQASVRRETNMLFSQASSAFQMGIMSKEQKDRIEELENCIANCKRIVSDYGSSPLAKDALYLQASAAFFKANTAQDYDEPISLFNQYIDRVSSQKLKAVGYVGLGYSYENKYFLTDDRQLLEQALSAYEKAIETGVNTASSAEAKLCKARLLELQYKDEQAAILYESVKEQRKHDPLIASPGEPQFRDPQLNFLSRQLNTIEDMFSYSETAQFSLERLEGQK